MTINTMIDHVWPGMFPRRHGPAGPAMRARRHRVLPGQAKPARNSPVLSREEIRQAVIEVLG
jgi:hypothetical protein